MRIIDMHIHSDGGMPDPVGLIEKMETAGVYGGVIFSNPVESGEAFEKRFDDVMAWTEGYPGRLFPVMFVHPKEKKVLYHVENAVKSGICGFKIICHDFYVHSPESLDLIKCIAQMEKPIFFHSGILWSGTCSSQYNRPVYWENLISIPRLKFSLAHCSWPWQDECLAVYGKFLNSYAKNSGKAEMYIDVTPGTPRIYRNEMWHKIFYIGYDIPHNILYGTDSNTSTYRADWVKSWLSYDLQIWDVLEVPEHVREWIFYDNILRFLGVSKHNIVHSLPVHDNGFTWSLDSEK